MADLPEPGAAAGPAGSASATSVSAASSGAGPEAIPEQETVGSVASLYLGNLLYALERCALSLDAEDRPLDAAFYRGIGRKLAEAHGNSRKTAP